MFDVIFEILQSARPMHLFGTFAGILGTAGAFLGTTSALAQNELGGSTIPTAPALAGGAARTNTVTLTATNFVASGISVSNGVLVGSAVSSAPPTSIMGTNVTVRPITLDEAIQMALENNYSIQFAKYNPEIAQFTLSGSYAVYEPALQFAYDHSFNSSPGGRDQQGLVLPSVEVVQDAFSGSIAPGVSGYLPTGTRYGFNTSVSDRQVTGLLGTTEQYNGLGVFTLQQPLLRDFWIDQSRATIQINKKRLKISEWQLRGQLITTIAAVQNAYYDLIRSRENIRVQRAALDSNNQLLRENKKRVEVGALAPLDEKQSEAEVAHAVATLLQTEQIYALSLNNLKNLITQDFSNWVQIVLDPVETLVAVPSSPELPESWKRGLTMRPEIQEAKIDLESRDINLKFLKNQMWPMLDLNGTYGENSLNTSYHTALSDLTKDENPRYSIGVVLSIPLGNRRARNDFKAARSSKLQALVDYKALEQNVLVQIDNAIKLLTSQFQQVEAARQARLFAQDALSAEQKKYENGKSTSYDVLLKQRDLTSRRFEEVAALADYNKALVGLAQSEGTTLEQFNLGLSIK